MRERVAHHQACTHNHSNIGADGESVAVGEDKTHSSSASVCTRDGSVLDATERAVEAMELLIVGQQGVIADLHLTIEQLISAQQVLCTSFVCVLVRARRVRCDRPFSHLLGKTG